MSFTQAPPAAELVLGTDNGVRNIVPMLRLTRTWNSVCAVAFMRRGLALACDYARRRKDFGAPLAEQPLHLDTLAAIQAETEAAFHLTFLLVELIGRDEAQENDSDGQALLRLLSSIVKLTTGRQAVAVASEVLEAFGGAGYVEDTGLPMLLRDSQVLTIWEGTTDVLSLDALRALEDPTSLATLQTLIDRTRGELRDRKLAEAGTKAAAAIDTAAAWLAEARDNGRESLESGARRLALTIGRALALALTARHAQWLLDVEGDGRSRAAALCKTWCRSRGNRRSACKPEPRDGRSHLRCFGWVPACAGMTIQDGAGFRYFGSFSIQDGADRSRTVPGFGDPVVSRHAATGRALSAVLIRELTRTAEIPKPGTIP